MPLHRHGPLGGHADASWQQRAQGFLGLGFRGLGFRGLGFRVWKFRGLGFRGLGLRAIFSILSRVRLLQVLPVVFFRFWVAGLQQVVTIKIY